MQTLSRSPKITLSALMLLMCLLGFNKAYATHLAAMDISVKYDCSGPSGLDYKVVLDVYYSCEVGQNPPAGSLPIFYFSGNEGGAQNGFYTGNRSVNVPAVPVRIVDQLCDKNQSECLSTAATAFPGFWHGRYETTITLTSRQTDWVFYASTSDRNGGIVNITDNPNIQDPEGAIFIECGLDNLTKLENETPIFGISPLPYLCVNQPSTYLNAPYDALNDSVVVTNVVPRSNAVTYYLYWPVPNQPYFTAANPIASAATNPYNVDPVTGNATFTPTLTGKFVLAFRCDKYDRKTKKRIGFTHRDVQVSVLPCNGPLPDITDPAKLTNTTIVDDKYIACTGATMSFEIAASSKMANRKMYITANTETVPGSNVASTGAGTPNITGTWSWTPHFGNVGEHLVILTAYDSSCDAGNPIVLKQHKAIIVKVIPSIDAGMDKVFCAGTDSKPVELYVRGADNYRLKWTNLDGSPATSLSNDTIQNPVMYPERLPYPGQQVAFIVVAPDVPSICKNKDEITLNADTSVTINISPDNPIIMCRPDYLQMDALIKGTGPVNNLKCGFQYFDDTTKKLDSLFVNGNLEGSFDTLGAVTPTLPTTVANVKQQFFIRRADLLESNFLASHLKSISFEAKGVDPIYLYDNFKISVKCMPELAVECVSNFAAGMTTVYTAPGPIALVEGVNKFDFVNIYNWDTTQNLMIEICYSKNPAVNPAGFDPIIKFVPTDYVSTLTLSHATTDVCPILKSTDIKRTYSRPQFRFYFREPSKPFTITWLPGNLLSDSTIQQPLAYVPKSITYYATTRGRNGCLVKDSAEIYVPTPSYSVTPSDTAICFGETAPLHVKGGFTYKWYEYKDGVYTLATRNANCWDCAEPILTPQATTIYKIVVYDSVWCTDTLTARVEVMPLPDVKILNRDTVVKYGQSLQLMVSGARMYNWLNAASVTNTSMANPIARPTEPTEYIVGGIGRNGCRAFDTLKVDVDYRDNLFIPSAFSPNGDGKNDVFKVSNLSFQRVMEFRVFNRWGQEVFYSNDNQHGWDGNWKGVPQDMGSYTYMMRLGYPDGLVESFKGEVTLVR